MLADQLYINGCKKTKNNRHNEINNNKHVKLV